MNEEHTFAWILLSVPDKKPRSIEGVLAMADAINHAIPTDIELNSSLEWLQSNGLIQKRNERYVRTEAAQALFKEAEKKRDRRRRGKNMNYFQQWDLIEEELRIMRETQGRK